MKIINSSFVNSLVALGILAGLSSCQSADTHNASKTPVKQNTSKASQEQTSRENGMDLNQQLLVSKRDLADRLGIDMDTIKIVTARKITWRSGALGCPKPGMNYTQALVPGVLILLEAGGETYGYHAEKDQEPFYCPSRQAVIPDSIQKEDLA